jgi:spermidine/putrescine transport system permease protein
MPGETSKAAALGVGRGLWLRTVSLLGVLFLLAPLLMLVLFSFNSSMSVSRWEGATLKWYEAALADSSLWTAVRNSLVIAVASTAVSTVLGTLAALAIGARAFRGRRLFQSLLHIQIILPEIIFGVSLLALFILIRMPLGLTSITCAHITFSISFVTLIVLAKVRNLDPNIELACLDLGASRLRAFFDVVLPAISPGVVAGALFAFTLSIDDFIVTFFTAGSGASTLPLKIYSLIRYGITPVVNAVSTLLIAFTAAAIVTVVLLQKSAQARNRPKAFGLALLGVAVVALGAAFVFSPKEKRVLHIINYSDYMDDTILADFEKAHGIKVTVDYCNSNEEVLAKMQLGATGYDIIVPASFMVEIMIREGLLAPLDFSSIPNERYIDPVFRRLPYDPEGRYYVPYAYGFVGITYNTRLVTEPVDSWWVMWDPRYKGKMTMTDDMRGAFDVANRLLGYSNGDTDPAHLAKARDLLIRQKPLLRKYENNLIKEMLISGDVTLAQDWSGSMQKLRPEHPEFAFVLPKEGAPMFIDNLAIPKTSRNKELAERFIDFLLQPENAARNPAARALLDEKLRNDPVVFPPVDNLERYGIARDLGAFAAEMDRAWTEVKAQ